MKKIYIISKFQNKDDVSHLEALLSASGFEITSKWTTHEDCKPYSIHEKLAVIQALEDTVWIDEADMIIYLYNGVKGVGSFFELGYAYARIKKIVICDISEAKDAKDTSMFVHLPGINSIDVTTIRDIVEYIKHYK